MKKIKLPHGEYIKFAQFILSNDGEVAIVQIEFKYLPSLAMIVEASAQSTAGLAIGEPKMGYLVSLKNIKLINELKFLKYNVKIMKQHALGRLTYFDFEVFLESKVFTTGTFMIAID